MYWTPLLLLDLTFTFLRPLVRNSPPQCAKLEAAGSLTIISWGYTGGLTNTDTYLTVVRILEVPTRACMRVHYGIGNGLGRITSPVVFHVTHVMEEDEGPLVGRSVSAGEQARPFENGEKVW